MLCRSLPLLSQWVWCGVYHADFGIINSWWGGSLARRNWLGEPSIAMFDHPFRRLAVDAVCSVCGFCRSSRSLEGTV